MLNNSKRQGNERTRGEGISQAEMAEMANLKSLPISGYTGSIRKRWNGRFEDGREDITRF